MKYTVVVQYADEKNPNAFNAICATMVDDKGEAEISVEKEINQLRDNLVNILYEENYEDPESHVVIKKHKNCFGSHYELKTDVKDYERFNTRYDILRLF